MLGELTATTRAWFGNALVEFCFVEHQASDTKKATRESDGERNYRYDERGLSYAVRFGLVLECSR